MFCWFFFISYRLQAQRLYFTSAVDSVLEKYCTSCFLKPSVDNQLFLFDGDASKEYFNKSYSSLRIGHLKEAYINSQLLQDALKKTPDDKFTASAIFLEARVLQWIDSIPEAVNKYKEFLNWKNGDSVLKAETYTSLIQLYLDKQAWNMASGYLYEWHNRYERFSGVRTIRSVRNRIALITSRLTQVINPQDAVRLSTSFFTVAKDTPSLFAVCYNVANWHIGHSRYLEAEPYLKKGISLMIQSLPAKCKLDFYALLSVAAEKKGELQKALALRKTYDTMEKRWQMHQDSLLQLSRIAVDVTPGGTGISIGDFSESNDSFYGQLRNTIWQRNFFAVLTLLLLGVSLQVIIRNFGNNRIINLLNMQLQKIDGLNRSKDQLFAIVSHDLRSALYTLQINVKQVRTMLATQLNPDATGLVNQIGRIVESTLALLNNLLYWSLSETGQIIYKVEVIDMRLLVSQVCYDFIPLADYKKIRLNNMLVKDYSCIADLNSIKVILRNIIDNAIKFTNADGSVTIFATTEDQNFRLTISDNGIGMEQDLIYSILNTETKRVQQDTQGRQSMGIGLWLAKSMAEENNGSLKISSTKDKGTDITLILPMDPG